MFGTVFLLSVTPEQKYFLAMTVILTVDAAATLPGCSDLAPKII